MSCVCLWSPSWPIGADFPADLASALLAHAPRITVGERGRVWADARGLHASTLAEQLLAVANEYGFSDAHATAAMTPIAAEVGATLSSAPLIVVRPGNDRQYIATAPLSVLAPNEQLARLLDGLGVHTCGALATLDAESVEVRLGGAGVRLWELARADDHRWLFRAPIRELPSASLEWVEYGLKDPERLLFVINALAGTVCAALASRGARARDMSLVFSLGNRMQRVETIRSSRPSAEQKRWIRLVREALEKLSLPDAVTGVALRVETATGNDAAQGDLFDRGFASASAVESAILELTDDQGDVVVAAQNSSHPLLEQRTTWAPEKTSRVATLGARAARVREEKGEFRAEVRSAEERNYQLPGLTLQLLSSPKVVSVTTEPRRDHQVPVRYLDDNEWHDLLEVAGPDRVEGGEWNGAYARDYFRCVREDGMMVWLFKGAPDSADWFLQGWWD